MRGRFDVIIMGCGSTGSSILFNLCKKGVTNVLVLEKGRAGWGQTSRSSACIRLHYTHPVIRDMAVFSLRFWRDKFNEETGCEYRVFTRTGAAFVGPHDYLEEMRKVVDDLRKKGVEARLYDPEEFKKDVFKQFNEEGIAAVAYEAESGYGDPNTSVQCFVKAAKGMGAEVKEGERVKRLILSNGAIVRVVTDKGEYSADYVVNALGVWANEVLETIGIRLPFVYGREDVLLVKNPGRREEVPPLWGDLVLGFYSRPDGDRLTLIGGLDVEYVDRYDEAGDYTAPPLDLIVKRMDAFSKRFPHYVTAEPYKAWYGYYDITPDWQPILGFDGRVKNLIHAVGLSGHGFKLAPAFGDAISDLIIHGRSKNFKLDELSIRRFEKGESARGKYRYGIVG